MNGIAVVAIGRNEGDRLKRCLQSVIHAADLVVYVDSGSTDGSVAYAQGIGAEVVALDMSQPFTAARARNRGFARALELRPDLAYVQFVDGDCEVQPNWLGQSLSFLAQHPEVAVACGRRRERQPQASIYNQLCDLEWDTPIGEAKACGGDALMRVSALSAVRGYRDDVIAGEEPELCIRLRSQGWKVWRLDLEMTLHDAAMTRFEQWWTRAIRCGYAYALGSHLHGHPPERHWVWETRRAVVWGGLLPLLSVLGTAWIGPWSLAGVLLYPVQALRLWRRSPLTGPIALSDAWFKTLAKLPEMIGIWRFWRDRALRRTPRIIEYK